jgi:uncharacterized protein
MSSLLDHIKTVVQNTAEADDWLYHIEPVARYALELAQCLHADTETVVLSAYLHDIGRQMEGGNDETHHLLGEARARSLLQEQGADPDLIARVCLCILRHRASGEHRPQTLEEKIVANADAMSHFDMIPLFFYWRASYMPYEELSDWVRKKLRRDWEEKMTLPEARSMIQSRYEAAKQLLHF